MTEQGRLALPKSPIGQAIAYAQSNWVALCRYPEHGELSIDNNLAERMLRAQAIGRRNWTFLGRGPDGGHPVLLDRHLQAPRHRSLRVPRRRPPSSSVPSGRATRGAVAGHLVHVASLGTAQDGRVTRSRHLAGTWAPNRSRVTTRSPGTRPAQVIAKKEPPVNPGEVQAEDLRPRAFRLHDAADPPAVGRGGRGGPNAVAGEDRPSDRRRGLPGGEIDP